MDYKELLEKYNLLLNENIRLTEENNLLKAKLGITRIEGPAKDGRTIHAICRFKEHGILIIIMVYALLEER